MYRPPFFLLLYPYFLPTTEGTRKAGRRGRRKEIIKKTK